MRSDLAHPSPEKTVFALEKEQVGRWRGLLRECGLESIKGNNKMEAACAGASSVLQDLRCPAENGRDMTEQCQEGRK